MSDSLGDMVVNFVANLDGLNAGAAEAEQQLNNVQAAGDNASNAGGGFTGAISGLMSFAQNAYMTVMSLQGLANAAISTAQAMLAPAAQAEQTGVAYTTLMHSASGASAELAKLNTFAATTPFQTQAIDDAGSKLLAFNFKASQIIPIVTGIGDSLSALGKGTPAALSSIVDIFGKIQAAGKLTGGDMMQLSAWGIPAWNMLSEVMGKPVSVLQKMVSSGLIPAKTAIADLTAGMEKTFGGGMAKQANTFNGLMSTFQSNVTLAWNSFLGVNGGQVTKGSLFDIVEQGLNQVGNLVSNPAFQQFAQTMGVQVGDAVQKVGAFVASYIVPAFQSLPGYVNIGIEAFQEIASFIQSPFLPAVQQVGNFIASTLVPPLMNLGTTLSPLVPPLMSLGTNLLNLGIAAGAFVVQVVQWSIQNNVLGKTFAAVTIGFAILVQAIGFAITAINTIIVVSEAVVNWFITWREPILTVAGILLTFFAPALITVGVQAAIAGTKLAISFVQSMIQTGVEAVVSGYKITVSFIQAMIETGTAAVVNAAKVTGSFVLSLIDTGAEAWVASGSLITSMIPAFVSSGVEAVTAAASITGSFIASLVVTAAQAIATGVSFTASLIPSVIAFASEALIAAATAIPAILAGFVAWIAGAAAVAIANIAAFWPVYLVVAAIIAIIAIVVLAVQHWGAIMAWFGSVWQGIVNGVIYAWNATLHGIGEGITWIEDALRAAGTAIYNIFVQPFVNAWNTISGIFSNISNAASNVLGGVGNALSSIHIPGFASGGTNLPAGLKVVGENGPELIYTGAGASILNNTQTSALFGGSASSSALAAGGGTVHIHNHLYIDGHELASVMVNPLGEMMAGQIRTYGPVGMVA